MVRFSAKSPGSHLDAQLFHLLDAALGKEAHLAPDALFGMGVSGHAVILDEDARRYGRLAGPFLIAVTNSNNNTFRHFIFLFTH